MREWLRGGVQPCQGWGRGFESRLALFLFGRVNAEESSVYAVFSRFKRCFYYQLRDENIIFKRKICARICARLVHDLRDPVRYDHGRLFFVHSLPVVFRHNVGS